MRLKYYLTTIRQMKVKKSFVLFCIIVVLVILIVSTIFSKSVSPTLKTLSESNAKTVALKSSSDAIKETINSIQYEDLITVQKDNNGKITALSANVEKMNIIANEVVENTQAKLENSSINYIKVPLGTFFGITMLGGHGIKLKINTLPTGICKAEFKSEFDNTGINQTRHRIMLVVTVEIKTIAPFFSDTEEYTNEVVIAETVIVGDTPTTYYDIEGIEDLTKNDTLNMTDNN